MQTPHAQYGCCRLKPWTARILILTLTCAAIAAAMPVASAFAQTATTYQAVVTGDDVYVRAGGGDTYYPFGKLDGGTVVTVTQERFGWGRIRTEGAAFRAMFGYVGAKDVRLGADGRTGTTLGRVPVLAPNMYREYAPEASWRPIGNIGAERTITIRERVEGDSGIFYAIELPEVCEGWISLQFLRKATDAEVAAAAREIVGRIEDDVQTSIASGTELVGPPYVGPDPEREASSGPVVIEIPGNDTQTQPPANTSNTPAAIEQPTTPQIPIDSDVEDVDDAGEPVVEADNTDTPETIETPEEGAYTSPIADLEASYESLKSIPIREAEIDVLRSQYQQALDSGELNRQDEAIAKARVQLLGARADLQTKLHELDQVRRRAALSAETAEAARLQLEMAAVYEAVGVIKASTVYNGERLPRLTRIIEPATGRTLAYLRDDDQFDFSAMIGQVVGVVGQRTYDNGMRLHIIEPRRVDLLTAAD